MNIFQFLILTQHILRISSMHIVTKGSIVTGAQAFHFLVVLPFLYMHLILYCLLQLVLFLRYFQLVESTMCLYFFLSKTNIIFSKYLIKCFLQVYNGHTYFSFLLQILRYHLQRKYVIMHTSSSSKPSLCHMKCVFYHYPNSPVCNLFKHLYTCTQQRYSSIFTTLSLVALLKNRDCVSLLSFFWNMLLYTLLYFLVISQLPSNPYF